MNRLPFRRRREGKTNYRKRLALLKSGKPRVVVRRSNKNIRVQFALYDMNGDRIVASAIGTDLRKYGWEYSLSNTPAAYLTGLLAGKRALKKGLKEGVLDIGLYTPRRGARIFAALKGVVDAGVDVPYGEEIVPSEDRLYGKHISDEIAEKVEEIKSKIEEEYE
ncbi:MAG TPA: 50S ribosomal protein L18 [Thermoplasmatales archaeon]|nr:50S ribosomal protein L18 [Thermoplasmatales archaeon]